MTAMHASRAPSPVPAEATLTALRQPASTIAGLHGALDTTTAPVLRERLRGVLSPGVELLIIDLSGVSSCDVAGLAMLIGTQRRATARGITVRLASPSPQIAELLRVTGLDRSLTICATLADALPAQRPGARAARRPDPRVPLWSGTPASRGAGNGYCQPG